MAQSVTREELGTISSNHRSRNDKISTLERLSSEIFYEIFDYLTGNEIYGSFFGLNQRINKLIYNTPNVHLHLIESTTTLYHSFQRIFCTENIVSIVSDCCLETIPKRMGTTVSGGRLRSIALPNLSLQKFHTRVISFLTPLKQQLVRLKIELINEYPFGTSTETAETFQFLLIELSALKHFELNGSHHINPITYMNRGIINKTVISLMMSIHDHVDWTRILCRFEKLKFLVIDFRFTNEKRGVASRDSTSYFGNQIHKPLPVNCPFRFRRVKICQCNLILENIEQLFQLLISPDLLTLSLLNCQRPFTPFPNPNRQPPLLNGTEWHNLMKKYFRPTMKRFYIEYEDVDNTMSMTNLVEINHSLMKYNGSNSSWKICCAFNQRTKFLSFDFAFI